MKNPQKQFIFTCFPAIFRSRPHARFPLPAAYFCRDRFCRYGALPPCLFATAARRALYSPVPFESHTHAPRKFVSEFAGKNKPHAFRLYLPHVLPLLPPRVFFHPARIFPAARIFPRPYAFVFPAINRTPQRRFRAANICSRTDDTAESNRNRTDNSRPFIFPRHTPHRVAFPRPPQPKAQAKST